MKKTIITVLIILVGGGLMYGLLSGNKKAVESVKEEQEHTDEHGHDHDDVIHFSPEQIESFKIKVETAKPGRLFMTLTARGKIVLEPDRLAHILPKVSGVAKEGLRNIGDHVEKGDLLAILESREMADAKANFLAALEREKLAATLFDREKRLYDKKISSQQDFLNAQSAYEEAKINLLLAKQKLHAYGIVDEAINLLAQQKDPDLRIYEIYAPIDGILINRHITMGEFIETTSTIYEVANLNRVWIEIGIYPTDLSKVKVGQTVQVKLANGTQEGEAKIIFVSPIVQEEMITARAVAEMDNADENWRPGSFVQAMIDIGQIDAGVVISKEALQEIEGKDVVFVRIPEGFLKQEVQLGRSDKNNVEILSGLKPGEEYAVTKSFLLKADLGKSEAEHDH